MNIKYCMKNRCNGCKNYGICFNYKPKRRKKDEVDKTKSRRVHKEMQRKRTKILECEGLLEKS